MVWEPIDSAPKGGGAPLTTDPAWVEPPRLLLAFAHGQVSVGYWDWYYAEHGGGYDPPHLAWIEPISGEQLDRYLGAPTHWRRVPVAPGGVDERT